MSRQPTCDCGECKKCRHREYMRGWYQRMTPEERRAWVNKRDRELVRQSDRNRYYRDKEKRLAQQAAWRRVDRALNPDKWSARNKVSRAVRSGVLTKGVCAVCGETMVEAHHVDYDRPLDVFWLCSVHHGEVHRKHDESKTEPF